MGGKTGGQPSTERDRIDTRTKIGRQMRTDTREVNTVTRTRSEQSATHTRNRDIQIHMETDSDRNGDR